VEREKKKKKYKFKIGKIGKIDNECDVDTSYFFFFFSSVYSIPCF
jgi:hypothetical protein